MVRIPVWSVLLLEFNRSMDGLKMAQVKLIKVLVEVGLYCTYESSVLTEVI